MRTGLTWMVFLILALPAASQAGRNRSTIDLFTSDHGLSQAFVNSVYQDSKGFLWIGTFDGLNRYDGCHFQVFKPSARDTSTLADGFITSITEDLDGNMWFGTRGGLSMYDHNRGNFINYTGRNGLLDDENILDLVSAPDSSLVFVTNSQARKFYYRTGRMLSISLGADRASSSSSGQSAALLVHSTGIHLIGNDQGVFISDWPTGRLFPVRWASGQVPGRVNAMAEDHDQRVWIASSNGLFLYDPGDNIISDHTPQLKRRSPGQEWDVLGLYADHSGHLWLGLQNGICRFDPVSGSIVPYREIPYRNNLLDINHVCSIIADRTGIVWFGSRSGLGKLNPDGRTFRLYNRSIQNLSGLSGINITAIAIDQDDQIWVASPGKGVDVIRRSGEVILAHYSGSSKDPAYRLPEGDVLSIFHYRGREIWMGTSRGLYVIKGKNTPAVPFRQAYRGSPPDLSIERINQVSRALDGRLLISTGNGAFLYHPDSVSFVRYTPVTGGADTLGEDYILTSMQDSRLRLWFGTQQGLSVYDPVNQTMDHYSPDHSDPDHRISGNDVYCIQEDMMANLWVGTNRGLDRIDAISGIITTFSKRSGLQGEVIHAIQIDREGKIWISTDKGVASIHPGNFRISSFSPVDGLQGFEFNRGASCAAADGEIFFGGIMGFNSFYPDSVVLNDHIPTPSFTRVIVSAQGVEEEYPLMNGKVLTIRSRKTSITIEFSSLDFTDPQRNQYEYMLEGYDRSWERAGNANRARYANLPYGNYRLLVRGSNNHQVWCDMPAVLHIHVRASVFRTPLAVVIYLLITFVWIYFFFRYRTSSLRKANQLLRDKEIAAREIARQKEELSVKNRNITDSITYAQKIQEAMLPSAKLFSQILPNSFILYKPKDIVSGDFYWINKKNEKIFVASVDCTGHGVPGALMSMIGSELIRNIINIQHIEEPAQILDRLNRGIADSFNKEVERITLKDGMDLSLVSINLRSGILEFAGAFNSIYLIRDGSITELKADRYSVGLAEDPVTQRFTNHTISLEKDDVIYLFTDGYADQFGGPRQKKFMYRRFRHLLLTIHKLTLEQQKTILNETIEDWKGNLDQIDDILVIGFKPFSDQ